jgi:hypothetical protein
LSEPADRFKEDGLSRLLVVIGKQVPSDRICDDQHAPRANPSGERVRKII